MFVLGAVVLIVLLVNWDSWSAAQKVVAFVYVLLPFHVWEEWRLPGGFAYQYNWVMASSDQPDRYPMNQFTDMITVFGSMWFGIILLIIGVTPAVLISQTFFAFAEVGMHLNFGYRMHRRFKSKGKRTWYNPGLVTTLVGFLPIFIFGVVELFNSSLVLADGLKAIGILVISSVIVFLPERLFNRRDDVYAFQPGYYKCLSEKMLNRMNHL
jgi:hypothetical protein